jgi:hypothetical protein
MKKHDRRVLAGVIVIAIALAIGLGALYAFTPDVEKPGIIEGRPMLAPGDEPFYDRQVGLRFTPPPGWSMQARSAEAPDEPKRERMLVKYKRLVRGARVAWLRVSVVDVGDDQTAAELLKDRRPKEKEFAKTKDLESDLQIGGQPAARITFEGMLDPDSKGPRRCTAEIVAIRHKSLVFYFAGTFSTIDTEARDQVRAAIESITFE